MVPIRILYERSIAFWRGQALSLKFQCQELLLFGNIRIAILSIQFLVQHTANYKCIKRKKKKWVQTGFIIYFKFLASPTGNSARSVRSCIFLFYSSGFGVTLASFARREKVDLERENGALRSLFN